MANDVSGRQWRLDTAVPFGTAGAIIWNGAVLIKDAVFTGYGAQTDTCIIKDGAGRVVADATGSTTLAPIRMGEIGWVNSFCLDTLGSGVVVVYIK